VSGSLSEWHPWAEWHLAGLRSLPEASAAKSSWRCED
jgi:hypothetical protein